MCTPALNFYEAHLRPNSIYVYYFFTDPRSLWSSALSLRLISSQLYRLKTLSCIMYSLTSTISTPISIEYATAMSLGAQSLRRAIDLLHDNSKSEGMFG